MGQSSPKDVARGMFVCLCSVTAALALEYRLADAIPPGRMSTVLAAIGGVPGVDLNPDTPSFFRFGAQYRDEPAPAGVTDASVQPGLRPGTVGQISARIVFVRHRFGPTHHV